MQMGIPKLLEIFDDYLTDSSANVNVSCWVDQIAATYSIHTLVRLLASRRSRVRQAAAWALGHVGNENQVIWIGPLLSDRIRAVRNAADEARRLILQRTQSPWHDQTACQIEQLIADDRLNVASGLADDLIEETDCRSDAYMLRAWVRFCSGEIESACEDCKRSLAIDRYCYQACVALGQCLWHLGRDPAARECFFEAIRIYPDWEPARSGLVLLERARSIA